MESFYLTAIVTLLALIVYFYMGLRVGMARSTYNVPAPATSGDPIFERHFRVHMNTLEWMPIFLPSLWIFAGVWNDAAAAIIGLVWIVGRLIYMFAYVADPSKRSMGFFIQMLATAVLLFGSLGFIVGQVVAKLTS